MRLGGKKDLENDIHEEFGLVELWKCIRAMGISGHKPHPGIASHQWGILAWGSPCLGL